MGRFKIKLLPRPSDYAPGNRAGDGARAMGLRPRGGGGGASPPPGGGPTAKSRARKPPGKSQPGGRR